MVMNGQHVWQQNNHHLKRWDTAWVPNVLHVANVSRMIVKGARPPLSGLVEILSERSSKIRHFLTGACCTAPTPSAALSITHHAPPEAPSVLAGPHSVSTSPWLMQT
jgi:hypothetical protein